MTTKEIAEAVGKDASTVSRWIVETSCKMQEVSCKMQEAQQTKKPADYTLEETCAIIETGLGKNTADLFRMNAAQKQEQKRSSEDVAMIETLKMSTKAMALAIEYITQMQTSKRKKPVPLESNSRLIVYSSPIAKLLSLPQLDTWKQLPEDPNALIAFDVKYVHIKGLPGQNFLAVRHDSKFFDKALGPMYKAELKHDPSYFGVKQARMSSSVFTCLLFKWDML